MTIHPARFRQALLQIGDPMYLWASTKSRSEGAFWQAWLILLPVLILALIGFYALQQDRRLAESEARDRADRIAQDWLRSISDQWDRFEAVATNRNDFLSALASPAAGYFFEFDTDRRLIFPPDYPAVPEPEPFDVTMLGPIQLQLWREARTSDPLSGPSDAAGACQRLLQAALPPRFQAAAQFALALELAETGSIPDAVAMFAHVSALFPAEHSESGVPYGHLADLNRLKFSDLPQAALSPLFSNAVYRPSVLTPQLLGLTERAGAPRAADAAVEADYRALWASHELTREIFRSAVRPTQFPSSESIPLPHTLAFSVADKRLVAVRLNRALDATAKMLALLVGGHVLSDDARNILASNRDDCFGITVCVAGLVVHQEGFPDNRQPHLGHANSEAANDAQWPTMGTASKIQDNVELLKIHVHLADAASLYTRHRQRTVWFALIIVSAALTALFGWRTTRRAFSRQQQLNQMKTNFISSVSHELRAPIASLRLMAEGLENGRIKEDVKRREYFTLILQECRRLGSLIENVLDFSRIEQGRKEYEFEPTDAAALVRHTVELMKPYANERAIHLDCALIRPQPSTADSQPVLDGRAIQQALVNLIDNAVKHSPHGSTVTVGLDFPKLESRLTHHASRTRRDKAPDSRGDQCAIWVEDHGEGIPADEHERIFERFYRLGSELRRKTQGVGIGLSIVKHIVEAHGGTVTVRSAVGQGSRFTMELPMNRGHEGEESDRL